MRQEKKQNEFDGVPGALNVYSAKKKQYTDAKNKLLDNAKFFYKEREKIIEGFKNGIFPLNYDEREEQESRDKEEQIKISF